jgi:hypothetical protein
VSYLPETGFATYVLETGLCKLRTGDRALRVTY